MPYRLLAFLLPSLLFFHLSSVKAQPQQTFRGSVVENASLQPITGAIIMLQDDVAVYQTLTDSMGVFSLQVPVGRYNLNIHHLSYTPYQEAGLLIQASRLSAMRIQLNPRLELLEEVTVLANQAQPFPSISSLRFSVEETQRTPATFWDPARFVATAPGVTTTNDQANHLAVRGLPPWAVQWRLQDVLVLNPNHLANAGMQHDRAGFAGGGVNILSGQLLDQSQFWQGYYPARFGGALGGLFNMHLRPGTADKQHYTLQASLLGLDAASEGPIGKSGGSYLLNYRYSTVGLLSDLGINFGNESIQFQDVAFHIYLPTFKEGWFSVFGMGGLSSNQIAPMDDTAEWETEKDAISVNYMGEMAALGISLLTPLQGSTSFNATVAFSARNDERTEQFDFSPTDQIYQADDALSQHLWAANVKLQGLYRLFQWQAGIDGNLLVSKGYSKDLAPTPVHYYAGSTRQTLFAPFIEASFSLNQFLKAELGFRYAYRPSLSVAVAEPRFKVEWQTLPSLKLWIQAGATSQLLPAPYLIAHDNALDLNQLTPLKSMLLSLGQQWQLTDKWLLETEAFIQQLNHIGTSATNPAITSLNHLGDAPIEAFTTTGSANSRGISLQLQHPFTNGYFLRINGTLQRSTSVGGARLQHDPGWSSALVWGKEWQKEKKEGVRRIGLYGRSALRGGYYMPLIDITASQAALRTRWDYASNIQLPAYFSLDLRLSHTREKKEYTRTLSLDLQNLTGRENIAGYYYDRLLQEVRPLQQLGLIPVLAYRVEF